MKEDAKDVTVFRDWLKRLVEISQSTPDYPSNASWQYIKGYIESAESFLEEQS